VLNGTNIDISIDHVNNTLEGLRDAINQSAAPVTATIINVSGGTTADYRLLIQSDETGTAHAVSVSSNLTGGVDPFPSGGEVVQEASDAVFGVNGLRISRSTNVISDVIPGLTLTLLNEGDRDGVIDATDPSAKIAVIPDQAEAAEAISNLVDDFNAINDIINEQFSLAPNSNRQGSTAGDAALRGVMSSLRKELSAAGGLGRFTYLSDIGVRFGKDGSLTLDKVKLASALESDSTSVSNLFTAGENGIGTRLSETIDDFISTISGSLLLRQKGIGQSIKQIDDKIAREEARIARMEEHLLRKFNALEELVSQLKSQGDFLAQQLTGLQNARNR
jgi:flagellar hook-associated protein 2